VSSKVTSSEDVGTTDDQLASVAVVFEVALKFVDAPPNHVIGAADAEGIRASAEEALKTTEMVRKDWKAAGRTKSERKDLGFMSFSGESGIRGLG
jgi:hypothetical protein